MAHGGPERVQWPWLPLAGALAYPLYLIHEYWGFYVINRTLEQFGKYGAVAAAVIVSLVMAGLIHAFAERPLAPRLRRTLTLRLERCS